MQGTGPRSYRSLPWQLPRGTELSLLGPVLKGGGGAVLEGEGGGGGTVECGKRSHNQFPNFKKNVKKISKKFQKNFKNVQKNVPKTFQEQN